MPPHNPWAVSGRDLPLQHCRASVYNAMPIEGAQALVEFLTKFEAEHK